MVGDSLGYRDHAEVACGVLGYGGCDLVGVVSGVYEWFDPHERRRVADESPTKIREASQSGYAAGQKELNKILRSRAFQGLELAAETLGKQMAYHENVKKAISTVASGLAQNTEITVRRWERPERMDCVMELRAFVPSFQLNYAVVLEPQDMYRSAY